MVIQSFTPFHFLPISCEYFILSVLVCVVNHGCSIALWTTSSLCVAVFGKFVSQNEISKKKKFFFFTDTFFSFNCFTKINF
jgi:uncharacterized membrane protein YobD (UPF0266 family)